MFWCSDNLSQVVLKLLCHLTSKVHHKTHWCVSGWVIWESPGWNPGWSHQFESADTHAMGGGLHEESVGENINICLWKYLPTCCTVRKCRVCINYYLNTNSGHILTANTNAGYTKSDYVVTVKYDNPYTCICINCKINTNSMFIKLYANTRFLYLMYKIQGLYINSKYLIFDLGKHSLLINIDA